MCCFCYNYVCQYFPNGVFIFDYLSDNLLYPPCGVAPDGAPQAAEVRQAALALMLNANAMWARMILMAYINFQPEDMKTAKGRKDCEFFSSAVAIAMGMIARRMHSYDRYSRPLSGFLFQSFRWAEKEVLRNLSAPEEPRPIVYDPAMLQISRLPKEMSYQKKNRDDLKGEGYLAGKMGSSHGTVARYPLHEKEEEGDDRPGIGYFILHMSEDEMLEALQSCEENGMPVSTAMTGKERVYSPEERRHIFARFAAWWNARSPTPGTPFDLAVFERYFVYKENPAAAWQALAAAYPQHNAGQAKNNLYNKSCPAYKKFAAEDAQLVRDAALQKLYELLKQKYS